MDIQDAQEKIPDILDIDVHDRLLAKIYELAEILYYNVTNS